MIGGTALTLGSGYGELPVMAAVVSLIGLGLTLTAVSRSARAFGRSHPSPSA